MNDVKAIRKGEELDSHALENYLKEQLPDLKGPMKVGQFHGGHANLTYWLQFGDTELVLRRPPFGKIAPGAHDMKREYKVLSKLYTYFPQAPRAYHLCLDESIIGAKFVVLERRKGIVIRTEIPAHFLKMERIYERLTNAIITTLAQLHKVDVAEADLTNLGRPEGFAQRQLKGWGQRWALAKTEENADMDWVFEQLSAAIPIPQAVAIIHNDIKFDNCQFDFDNPDEIASVFDWDMTTIGDPLIDVGTFLSYWPEPLVQSFENLPTRLFGDFPSKEMVIKQYSDLTGYSMERISWYEAFAYWKGAIILQQLYKRYVDGATKDKRMAKLGKGAAQFAEVARKKLEKG